MFNILKLNLGPPGQWRIRGLRLSSKLSVLFANVFDRTASHGAFRTRPIQAGRPSIGKEQGRSLPGKPQHLLGHVANFPLRPTTATQLEKVVQLPNIHGHDQLGGGRVGQNEAGIFGRHPGGHQVAIQRVGRLHVRGKSLRQNRLLTDAVRDDGFEWLIMRHIALALLGKRGDAVTDQLMGAGAADALDAVSK